MFFGHWSLNSCNCRRGNCKFANVSQILSRDIRESGLEITLWYQFRIHFGVKVYTVLWNWRIRLPKGSLWRSLLHPQSRCHAMWMVAPSRTLQIVNLLTVSYKTTILKTLRIVKFANPCEGLAFWRFRNELKTDRKSRFPKDPYFLSIF